MTTTASGTTRDKQNKSFVNSPVRGDSLTAQEVVDTSPISKIAVSSYFQSMLNSITFDVVQSSYNEETNIETIVFFNDGIQCAEFQIERNNYNYTIRKIIQSFLLQENGDLLLQENGDKIII